MLTIAAALFAIAALGGIVLAGLHFSGRPLPWAVSIVHGLVAAAGLVTLVLAALSGSGSTILHTAIGLFVLAALGGFYMAFTHYSRSTRPSGVVVIHGLAAVVAFGLLLFAMVG